MIIHESLSLAGSFLQHLLTLVLTDKDKFMQVEGLEGNKVYGEPSLSLSFVSQLFTILFNNLTLIRNFFLDFLFPLHNTTF